MAEVVSTGVSHMCDNSTASVKSIILFIAKKLPCICMHGICSGECSVLLDNACMWLLPWLSTEQLLYYYYYISDSVLS